ncbi:unnamed protein product [Rotaria sp. Silwood2]|nr:unnamed protein product [Rotaria sp. Silwood2]CAF2470974.1 unnamed protein product [Rotaria sp. Silwood2]CAF2706784.1 unnamed protein product [Rotaria sp. Silwood2]CAF2858689.1 unnamed protein product [Rotaria sp. Silwood2]CAF3894637.1 unnamed protein product [Rotaria sp. Silwood2]
MKTCVSQNSGARYEAPKQGLQRKRFCTDIPCCFIFLIFIILFIILSIFAFKEGDPEQLIHPTDSQGNLCGTGNFLDRPYLYFFDWTQCIKAFNIPTNILKGRSSICSTTQVCVQQCPNKTSYYKFQNYYANRICTYDVSATETDNEKLVNEGKCALYIIASKSLFGRCIPEQIQSLANSIIQVSDANGVNWTVYDSNGQPLNGTHLAQGVKYLVELLNLKQIGAFLVEDLTTSWKYILIALAFAAVVSFVWIVLMRWLAKPVVWLGIILFIFSLGVITGLSFYEFTQLRKKNDNQIITEFKFVTDANYYRSLPITWLIIGIISGLLLLISLLILFAILKRLRIALAILKEASKAVGYNFFSLFWPFIPFLLQIGVFVYWAFVAVYLATSGKPIYRIAYNETTENTTNLLLGEICDPNKWNNNNELNGTCVFWQYGYDPQVDLDSILNGTGNHFKSFISFVNQYQWIPQIFSAFMLFWLTAFVIGFSQLVLAGIYARYYWDRERFGVPCSSLFASLFRALIFHLGTIAFGSLIIAIVKVIRGILEYVEKKVKDKTGTIARCLFCCCRCCLFCLEKFLKFLNRNAYIITAIYGTGFFTSARRAFHLIVSNPLRLLVIDKVCDFLIFLGKLCITAGIGILAFFFFTHRIAQAEKYVPELRYYFVPLLLIIVGTYIIATCFFSVYSMAVDTLFICAIQDIQLQDNNKDHKLVMPKGLKKVFRQQNQ